MSGFFKRQSNGLCVILAFCSALLLGTLKAVLVGPIASLIIIFGDVGVILGLLPSHLLWTVYTLVKTNRFDVPLKIAFLFGLPGLFGLWLCLSVASSVLVGLGYGFLTPWVSTFEAFRQESVARKFLHCIVDGTWDTIKGSCTVVRDFADICYHSYPLYLKELRVVSSLNEPRKLRLLHVPACIVVGMIGLVVVIPLYTIIGIVKSPYLLFMGWYRLLHDLISREGPFLETACIPIAGLTIIFWPLVVVGSVLLAILSSFFVGLYGSVIVYQERSFWRARPHYRKKLFSPSTESMRGSHRSVGISFIAASSEAPAMLMPSLAPSRSVKEVIHEVKLVQIWEQMMKGCEERGRLLIDAKVILPTDLIEWSRLKRTTDETIISVGLPSYSLLLTLVQSIEAGSVGLLLFNGLEVNQFNRPQDRLVDWFFQPIIVLKEQINAIKLGESEMRFLEKVVLYGSDNQRMKGWANGCGVPPDPVRVAQIQGISRRLTGMTRSISKFPTYRRRYSQVVKALGSYCLETGGSSNSNSMRYASTEIV